MAEIEKEAVGSPVINLQSNYRMSKISWDIILSSGVAKNVICTIWVILKKRSYATLWQGELT